ncbi:tetratricopeptide repeat protein [Sphaerisporangium album]|uniref:tetratricopeptide repeat protein n=1 Tax=Sphaerisporangium album TaxID=509200 RepID=UPI0011C07559|nr:tetratricopeptide repeat protein [Sphaerisporangium album]
MANRWNEIDPGEPTMAKGRIYQFEVWPTGGRRPTPYNLQIMARIYQTSVRALLADDEFALYDRVAQAQIEQADSCDDDDRPQSSSMTSRDVATKQSESTTKSGARNILISGGAKTYPLREARIARNLSQEGMALELSLVAERMYQDGELRRRISISTRQYRRWETAQTPWPHKDNRAVIERYLNQPLDTLGFISPNIIPSPKSDVKDSSAGRKIGGITNLFTEPSTSFSPDPQKIVDAVSILHQELNRTLANTSITDGTDDHWRSVADSYGYTYRTTPPVAFLFNIGGDLAELHGLLERPLLTRQRRGLFHSAARMAGLLSTTLINLGKHRQARAWFYTATQAAQESEDRALQAWVLVRHAVSALYWGDPHGSIRLAQQAIGLVAKTPCVAALWAPAVQARALAQIGDRAAAYAAISSAEAAFDQLHSQITEQHSYGYTAAQLHFYRSNTLTNTGDYSAAYEAQSLALQLYNPSEFIDPSLIRIDHALCLAREGRPGEAARYTADLISELPSERRSPIIITRALEIRAAIPPRYRQAPEVKSLQQSLALPPGGETD